MLDRLERGNECYSRVDIKPPCFDKMGSEKLGRFFQYVMISWGAGYIDWVITLILLSSGCMISSGVSRYLPYFDLDKLVEVLN